MHDIATNYNNKAVAIFALTAFYPSALGGYFAVRIFDWLISMTC